MTERIIKNENNNNNNKMRVDICKVSYVKETRNKKWNGKTNRMTDMNKLKNSNKFVWVASIEENHFVTLI